MSGNLASPASVLRARLESFEPDAPLAMMSDAKAYPNQVLLGVRTAKVICVMTIDREEYDGMAIFRFLGMTTDEAAPGPDAMTRAKEAQKATHR